MINFKVIEKVQPGVIGGGTKKFYAIIEKNGELNLADLTTSIEKICTVSGADIRAVLYALVEVAAENLKRGTIVRLGDLGSLRISLSSDGAESAEKFNVKFIKKNRVIFTPGMRIKSLLELTTYHRV